jgi:hypothetical protein
MLKESNDEQVEQSSTASISRVQSPDSISYALNRASSHVTHAKLIDSKQYDKTMTRKMIEGDKSDKTQSHHQRKYFINRHVNK